MGTIQLEAAISQDPESIWPKLSALDSAKHLTNMIVDVEITSDDTRVCAMADGGRIVERIISTDDSTRRQAYTIAEGPFGQEHHNAAFQVFDDGDGRSRLVWTIDLLPEALVEAMREPMKAEFATIVERLSVAPANL